MDNQSWAPQSPDLSGYAPQSPDLTGHNIPDQSAYHSAWAPHSPDLAGLQDLDHQPYQQHQPPHAHAHQHPHSFDLNSTSGWEGHNQQEQQYYHNQPQLLHSPQSYHPHTNPQYPPTHAYQGYEEMPQTRAQRLQSAPGSNADWQLPAASSVKQEQDVKPPSQQGRRKNEANKAPPRQRANLNGIEVKTKFPHARIKRIMQADEDVGKVAQVTPAVMSKALELFMIRLITASASVAKSRGSKRVLTTHMKAAVMQDEQFDNLREIVDKIPDAPVKGGGGGDDDDDEPPSGAAGKKRKSKAEHRRERE